MAAIKRASSFVNACLIQGSLIPTVSLEFPLDEASQAHEEVIQRSNVKMGNIVLTF
jgi:NADPH:quinone reductase-like Zn-dependent oxidoreductase